MSKIKDLEEFNSRASLIKSNNKDLEAFIRHAIRKMIPGIRISKCYGKHYLATSPTRSFSEKEVKMALPNLGELHPDIICIIVKEYLGNTHSWLKCSYAHDLGFYFHTDCIFNIEIQDPLWEELADSLTYELEKTIQEFIYRGDRVLHLYVKSSPAAAKAIRLVKSAKGFSVTSIRKDDGEYLLEITWQ